MNQDIPADLRANVIRAIRLVSDRVAARPLGRGKHPAARDVGELIAAACTEVGISPHDYRTVVSASDELQELEREALREARYGGADPGPYGSISRESPSGKEGDTTKNRTHPPVKA